ncbi:MAG: hypothetical protein ACUVWP_02280 [bacterium]
MKFIEILFLSTILLSICFSQEVKLPQQYLNWEFGVSFTIPEGWTLNKNVPGYLAILNDQLELASFSVVAILMSEQKQFGDFKNIMKEHIGLSKEKETSLKNALKEPNYLIVESIYMVIDKNGELRNPYELLLYDNEPDTKLIEKLRSEKTPEEKIPKQTIGTYIYDTKEGEKKIHYRNIVIYSVAGNIGYVFINRAPKELYMKYITTFITLLKEIKPNNLSGGQYGLIGSMETKLENTGIISGRALKEGMSISGITVKLYANQEDYKLGKPLKETTTNSVGEFWFMDVKPANNMIIDAIGYVGTKKIKSWQPVYNITVEIGKVTFVNVEIE